MQIKFVANGIRYQIDTPLGMREQAQRDAAIVLNRQHQRELDAEFICKLTRNYTVQF